MYRSAWPGDEQHARGVLTGRLRLRGWGANARAGDAVGRYDTSQSGAVYCGPASGAMSVLEAIFGRWQDVGAETGALVPGVTDEYAVAGGRRRDFQSGFITWDATSGATTVTTPAGQLQPGPGDLIVFGYPAYHVGIFAGGGTLCDSQRSAAYSGLHDIWTYTNVSYGRF